MNDKKILALFPGQGSQKVGMGQDLYENSNSAKAVFDAANQALDINLTELCFNGPEDELTLTANVQPAILTHSIACYRVAQEKLGDKLNVLATAGHSLGEYSALVAANVIDFETATKLVNKRGKFMQAAVPVGSGKMLAVLKKEVPELEAALTDIPDVQIANINAPGQIVISGSADGIDRFQAENEGLRMIPLPVSVPSHCKLMEPARAQLAAELDQLTFNVAELPVYSNFTATASTDPATLKQALKDQITGRVRWVESMQQAIKDLGITTIIEFGPGNVLTGLMKRINKDIEKINIQTFADLEQLG